MFEHGSSQHKSVFVGVSNKLARVDEGRREAERVGLDCKRPGGNTNTTGSLVTDQGAVRLPKRIEDREDRRQQVGLGIVQAHY